MDTTKTPRLLEASGRITPREVLEAYEQTGWLPAFCSWIRKYEEGIKACALVALAEANGYRQADFPFADDPGWAFLAERLGESRYGGGFLQGFDSLVAPPEDDDMRVGYRDGQRTRRFVLAKYGGRR